ncbi:TPA: hypothetical protein QDZ34_000097 [Stenotrophomonas maltophilia]|nr:MULTISPECIES: hypothetical protein [Stenotrophomonas]MBN5140989.1 hypothetical protein [Stenotrophomonas maltophilia]HDS0947584.1 hypothetical protein [Stenotrophomonas maltophilia]HDS1024033.1 hypothetical protein [Stenotrophomonas maltophilia]HDS1029315.1 hypothetical protein [Stenotrophomonas maltophilia]HDS1032796.1 hypothetical protein [Stenotrophomonas maltophilia]
MNLMQEMLRAFVQGARETPAGFFSPIVGMWRIMSTQTDRAIARRQR